MRLQRSRDAIMRMGRKRGLTRRHRPGGAWSEKLLTLTLPHRPRDDVAARIAFVRSAWPHFRRALYEWISEHDRDSDALHWYAAHEWTVGADRHGHPHIHVWIWCPFLDGAEVTELWRSALEKVGFGELVLVGRRMKFGYEGNLIVDVRRVEAGAGAVHEVIKYIVKDLEATGEQVSPSLYAQVYLTLDGKRTHQGSRGLLKLGDFEARCACGTAGMFVVQVERATGENLPRGPATSKNPTGTARAGPGFS